MQFIDASSIFSKEKNRIFFSNENIDKIINLYRIKKEEPKISTVKTLEDIQSKEYSLDCKRYFAKEFNGENLKPLRDFVSIKRGLQSSSYDIKKDEETGYKILNLGDIQENVINYNSLQNIKIKKDSDQFDKYILKDNDIVITAKSTIIKSALVKLNNTNEKIIATGNLLIITPKTNNINPTYLKMFLDSNLAKEQINLIENGTVIKTINAKALEEIKIKFIPIEEQNKLATEYTENQNKILEYTKKINELKGNIDSSIKQIFMQYLENKNRTDNG